jgi:hypothetical protein
MFCTQSVYIRKMDGSVYFDSADLYLESCTTNRQKIAALDAIIDALMLTAAKAAGTANLKEYSLNNGQTIVRTMYNTMADVMAGIKAFETLRQMYINRINGRMVRLVDQSNFRRNNGRW